DLTQGVGELFAILAQAWIVGDVHQRRNGVQQAYRLLQLGHGGVRSGMKRGALVVCDGTSRRVLQVIRQHLVDVFLSGAELVGAAVSALEAERAALVATRLDGLQSARVGTEIEHGNGNID